MIKIKKKKEPNALLTYRCQQYVSYGDMPKEIKAEVLEQLMEEQGYLCAYCMRRIPQKKKKPSAIIEHWAPQSSNDTSMGLNYNNMLAVCSGNRGCGDDAYLTCDARKGDSLLTVNPLNPETLRTIRYKENGEIYSSDINIDNDLNIRLNLNCNMVQLPDCRAAALLELQKKVSRENLGKTASKEYFQNLLENIMQSDTSKSPYVGILINWLETKIR